MRNLITKITLCLFCLGLLALIAPPLSAQEEAPAPAPAEAPAAAPATPAAGTMVVNAPQSGSPSFWNVVMSGGVLGVILWLAIFFTSVACIALVVDAFLTVRVSKVMPPVLVSSVQTAMEQGDVMKALQLCEEDPCPVSNILSAGFSNVEEGFDTIQDAVSVAAALEEEKLMQRVNYLNVVGNLSPMLGLLGTVQGMIAAFAGLATTGAAGGGQLALAISQALWTTAFGLFVAIPGLAFFYYFRNRASTIIINMEMHTLEQIKVLRNVEVVEN